MTGGLRVYGCLTPLRENYISLMAACAAGGAAVSAAKGNTTTTTYDSKGRVTKKGFTNKGSLLYTYTEGIPYV